MGPRDAVDLAREALWLAMLVGAPVLLTGMVVGLVVGLLQAVTQIQEQTVAFVPKMIATVVVLALTLPWAVERMLQYAGDLIAGIPGRL